MILIIVTLSEIPINPLYITSGYLFPRFGWFIICVQQSLKLSIGIPNRQTVRKICLVSIKRIWVFVKNIRWSKEDGINYDDRVEKINCFIWSRFSNSFSLKIRRLRKKSSRYIYIQDLFAVAWSISILSEMKSFHETFEFFPFGFGPPLGRSVS